MNVLTITQMGKCYTLEFNEQRLILLNHKSLVWHMKHKVGFDKTAIKSILSVLEVEMSVSVELNYTERSAA